VTVLFTDLVGFTSFADGRDPERVRSQQQRYFDAASDAVTRHGGTVEKFIGDAVMAVWGTPIAREDDAQRAVRAGLEVVKAVEGLGHELAARAGIVTSQAAVTVGATDQAMVAGDMVNTAARLQASAEPGEVLADHPTVQAASGVIAFEPADERALRGKAAPMGTWRAVRVRASRATDVVEPPFVGRDDELRRLKDVLHATGRDRRVRLVSITGPAGVGKSRLVEELAGYARGLAGVTSWHTGRSPSYGEGIAFWALGEMVRRCAGLAEADEPEATRARIEATVREVVADPAEREWIRSALLALLGIAEGSEGGDSLFPAWRTFFERIAARASAVLVFEDLHWADAGTLEFIEHLLDWSRTQPILVVTVARPDLLDTRPGWGNRSNATSIMLQRLGHGEMQELLAGLLPGLPQQQIDEVVARSEGMPLYAVEMVRALLADGQIQRVGTVFELTGELGAIPIPASLRSLLAARLDSLAPDDRLLLRHASVVGLSFAADALAAVTGRSESDLAQRLRDLVRRELLEIEVDARSPERGQYRFVQSLIREVAYETLGLRERRARHLAAARHVEAVGSDEAAGALASHYLAAYRASEEGSEPRPIARPGLVPTSRRSSVSTTPSPLPPIRPSGPSSSRALPHPPPRLASPARWTSRGLPSTPSAMPTTTPWSRRRSPCSGM
jgi:class 3 adenylate cyclase